MGNNRNMFRNRSDQLFKIRKSWNQLTEDTNNDAFLTNAIQINRHQMPYFEDNIIHFLENSDRKYEHSY